VLNSRRGRPPAPSPRWRPRTATRAPPPPRTLPSSIPVSSLIFSHLSAPSARDDPRAWLAALPGAAFRPSGGGRAVCLPC
jgi:hypothetical protein